MTGQARVRNIDRRGVVIAGGGLVAQRCVETLRRLEFDGPVRIVSAERHLPYDRPPLSKRLLVSAQEPRVELRPADWYRNNRVEMLSETRVTGLRLAERLLLLADGSAVRFGKLVIATGSRPRTLPLLTGYENASVLRSLDDARALRRVLATRPRIAIVGAGFIGLEVAATARELGCSVTVIEADTCPLRPVLGTLIGGWFTRLHEEHGVTVRTGVTVQSVQGATTAEALVLSDDSSIEVDHVVVGVGVIPEVEWLSGSGIVCTNGVHTDEAGRTSAADVFAAGDAAAMYDADAERHLAGSHWEQAVRQAATVAHGIAGVPAPATSLPAFWSDQYGNRIQSIGRRRPTDAICLDGELEGRTFTALFKRDRRVVAAVLVNRPRDLAAARRAIERSTNGLRGAGG